MIPVAMAAAVNAPILGNFFHADDFLNLYRSLNERPLWPFLLQMYGGHLLLVRNTLFVLSQQAFGSDPAPYFALALATHLLNVGLVYRSARLLSGSWRWACIAAGLWGIAPAHLTTLGWHSVYGQVLAATAALWVFSRLAACHRNAPARPAAPLGWGLVLLLGSTCFGTGIGAAVVMPAVAWLLLPPSPLRRRALLALGAVALAMPALYAVAYYLEAVVSADPSNPTPYLLRHAWQITDHLRLLLGLIERGSTNLLLLDRPASVAPWLASALLAASAARALAASPGTIWRPLLAGLVFSIGAYSVIAVGRSPFAAHHVRLVAATDRYHYAGMAGLAVAGAVSLAGVGARRRLPERAANGALGAAALVITALAIALRPPVDHHDEARTETAQVLANIRGQIDAAPPGAEVRIPNRIFRSVGELNVATPTLFPGTAAVYAIFVPEDLVTGRRVVFTTPDPAVAAAARHGRRSASLLRLVPARPDGGGAHAR